MSLRPLGRTSIRHSETPLHESSVTHLGLDQHWGCQNSNQPFHPKQNKLISPLGPKFTFGVTMDLLVRSSPHSHLFLRWGSGGFAPSSFCVFFYGNHLVLFRT